MTLKLHGHLTIFLFLVVGRGTAVAQSNTFPANGNVGIGTTAPGFALEIGNSGVLRVDGPSSTGTAISVGGSGSLSIDAPYIPGGRFLVSSGGNVGIGTPNPSGLLDVEGSSTGLIVAGNNSNGSTGADIRIQRSFAAVWAGQAPDLELDDNGDHISAIMQVSSGGLQFFMGTSQWNESMRVAPSGNVGIGTTSPGAKLELNGNMLFTQPAAGGQPSGASITFSDATVQSTAWNGTTLGGDYAESIDVLGDRAAYEPGDVIVIDDSVTGKFNKSDKAYSKLVAGVYSTKPGLIGRRVTSDRHDKEAEVPMAMMGIVPTKVSTENGPIERGDLLVSSGIPGYAMKGTDRDRLTGAVIGKALAPLKSGSGVIEILLALQ